MSSPSFLRHLVVVLVWALLSVLSGLKAQGYLPGYSNRIHGVTLEQWTERGEFDLVRSCLRGLSGHPLLLPSGCHPDRATVEYIAFMEAAGRLDPGTSRLAREFQLNYPRDGRLEVLKFTHALVYLLQGDSTEAYAVLDSLDWYRLSLEQAQQYQFMMGEAWSNRDSAKAAKHWIMAQSAPGEFQVHARYALMLHRLRQSQHAEVLSLLPSIEQDVRYTSRTAYPRFCAYLLAGDTAKAMFFMDSVSRWPELVGRLILMQHAMEVAYCSGQSRPFRSYWLDAESQGYRALPTDTLRWAQLLLADQRWDTVVSLLKRTGHWPDSLQAKASYLTAHAWLAWGQAEQLDRYKAKARLAFQRVCDLEPEGVHREQAFYHYAKLSYEIGESPGNFRVLGSFLIQYPQSLFREEISEYLGDLAQKSHHYKESLRIVSGVRNKTNKVKALLQKLHYQLGIDYYNQKNYTEALKFLDSSLLYGVDSSVKAATLFWKGELYHVVGEYNQSFLWIKNFLDFGYFSEDLRILGCTRFAACYQMGHLAFRLERNAQAVKYLSLAVQLGQALQRPSEFEKAMHLDAYSRLGDAYLRNGQLDEAVEQFTYCIDQLRTGVEYANYQLAITYGLQRKNLKKRDQLVALIQDYPRSDYRLYGLLELAMTCYQDFSFDSSLWCIRRLEEDFPRHRLTFEALNLKGAVHLERGEDSLAFVVFEEVVNRAAGLPEARDALYELRQLSIRTNTPQRYLDAAGRAGLLATQDDPRDSILFESAQFSFDAGKFFEALSALTQYLEEYPGGYFRANALYLRSIAAQKVGDLPMQKADLEKLLEMPDNLFTERAMLLLAPLYVGMNKPSLAGKVYRRLLQGPFSARSRLEATLGLLRTSTALQHWFTVDSLAQGVMNAPEISVNDRSEVRWCLANAMRNRGDVSRATEGFQWLVDSTQSEWAARSHFNLAEMAFESGKAAQAQDLIFDLTDRWPQYAEWHGRGMLLLAEILIASNERDQAMAVLTNMIENRDADEITREAEVRLKSMKP
jgi:TolA-binding protein